LYVGAKNYIMKIFNQNIRKCNQEGDDCDIKHAWDEIKCITNFRHKS